MEDQRYGNHQLFLKRLMIELQREFVEARFFQQHVGLFKTMTGNPIKIGIEGQADLSSIFGPIGKRIEIEVKTGTGRQTEAQHRWQRMIEKHGGIYILARDIEQVKEEIKNGLYRNR